MAQKKTRRLVPILVGSGVGLAAAYLLVKRAQAQDFAVPSISFPPVTQETLDATSVQTGSVPSGPATTTGASASTASVVTKAQGAGAGSQVFSEAGASVGSGPVGYQVAGNTVTYKSASGDTLTAAVTSYQANGLPATGVAVTSDGPIIIDFATGLVTYPGQEIGTRAGLFPAPGTLDANTGKAFYESRGGPFIPLGARQDLDLAKLVAGSPNLLQLIPAEGNLTSQKQALFDGLVSGAVSTQADSRGYSIPDGRIALANAIWQDPVYRQVFGITSYDGAQSLAQLAYDRAQSKGGFEQRSNIAAYPYSYDPTGPLGPNPFQLNPTFSESGPHTPDYHLEALVTIDRLPVSFSTVDRASTSPNFQGFLSLNLGDGLVYVSNDGTTSLFVPDKSVNNVTGKVEGPVFFQATKAGAGTQVGSPVAGLLPNGVLTGHDVQLRGAIAVDGPGPSVQRRDGYGVTMGGQTMFLWASTNVAKQFTPAELTIITGTWNQPQVITVPFSSLTPQQQQAVIVQLQRTPAPTEAISIHVGLDYSVLNLPFLPPAQQQLWQRFLIAQRDESLRTGIDYLANWAAPPDTNPRNTVISRPQPALTGPYYVQSATGVLLTNPLALGQQVAWMLGPGVAESQTMYDIDLATVRSMLDASNLSSATQQQVLAQIKDARASGKECVCAQAVGVAVRWNTWAAALKRLNGGQDYGSILPISVPDPAVSPAFQYTRPPTRPANYTPLAKTTPTNPPDTSKLTNITRDGINAITVIFAIQLFANQLPQVIQSLFQAGARTLSQVENAFLTGARTGPRSNPIIALRLGSTSTGDPSLALKQVSTGISSLINALANPPRINAGLASPLPNPLATPRFGNLGFGQNQNLPNVPATSPNQSFQYTRPPTIPLGPVTPSQTGGPVPPPPPPTGPLQPPPQHVQGLPVPAPIVAPPAPILPRGLVGSGTSGGFGTGVIQPPASPPVSIGPTAPPVIFRPAPLGAPPPTAFAAPAPAPIIVAPSLSGVAQSLAAQGFRGGGGPFSRF